MAVDAINSIGGNGSAQQTARILNETILGYSNALKSTSSGIRITSPQIDPAGLAQFINLDAQVGQLDAADSNISNQISFSQVQSGTLQVAQSALSRMGELSVLAQDPTKSADDLSNYQAEFSQIQNFLSDLGSETFNSLNLFGSSGQSTTDGDGGSITSSAIDFSAAGSAGGIGDVFSGISLSSAGNASSALDIIKTAIDNLSGLRANVGANLQGLNFTQDTVGVTSQNLSAAGSKIMDADIATESSRLGAYKTLIDAGTINLVRVNNQPHATFQSFA